MRESILQGKLELPNYAGFSKKIGPEMAEIANKMFKALWLNYLKNKGSISLTYWSERFHNPRAFNIVLMSLSKAKWIESHSIPARNWAEATLLEDKLLQFVSIDELEQVRAFNKFQQYRQVNELTSVSNTTRINGRTRDTGLTREGFMKAGNVEYSYDAKYMEDNYDTIKANLTKSMDKIADMCPNLRHDRASYDSISVDVLDYHINNPKERFRGGRRDSDSRGRNIQGPLSKVGNYISCKDFRSLLVIPS